ncbi:MAG: hypothetical protein PWQ63_1570 [Methanolobus sp.]|nr:hypothetical protein [Methanolobus sp.]MDK2948410.1 hypothetical protein [Methanolobus sp.]
MIPELIEEREFIPIVLLTFVYVMYAKKAYIEDKSIKTLFLILVVYAMSLGFYLWFNKLL